MTTAAAPAAEKPTYTRAFFATHEGKETASLVVDPKNPNLEPGRPALFGTIDGTAVKAFVQPAGEKDGKPYGTFLSFSVSGAKQEDGSYAPSERFGTGRVVVTEDGRALLAINKEGAAKDAKAGFLTPLNEFKDNLPKLGLDTELQATRKAEHDAKKAAKVAAEGDEPKAKAAAPRP